MVLAFIFAAFSLAEGTAPLPEPIQRDEVCNHLKVAGTGTIEIANSVVDKKLALEYYEVMYGDGDIEMATTSSISQSAKKLRGSVNGSDVPLNLYDTVKLAYSGKTPLVGLKSIKSRAFYGGIGAEVQEFFQATEIEKIQTTYFASTNPAQFVKDPKRIAELMKASLVHAVGMDSKTSFNGTWITDAKWHKTFYKDIKVHEAFSGKFEVEKTLKFHDNPVPEQRDNPCRGIDC